MTQPSLAPLPDLRELRMTFLDKQLSYALSYEYTLPCFRRGEPKAETVRLRLHADPPERHAPKDADPDPSRRDLAKDAIVFSELGKVFLVFGGDRVPGLDNLGRDVPTDFKVQTADESVVMRRPPIARPGYVERAGYIEATAGTIDGRMILEAPRERADNEPLRIAVSYNGTLQLSDAIELGTTVDGAPKEEFRASAFVIPFFETSHPKYHWLTENACIAFGTWELEVGRVKASFDVYCAS